MCQAAGKTGTGTDLSSGFRVACFVKSDPKGELGLSRTPREPVRDGLVGSRDGPIAAGDGLDLGDTVGVIGEDDLEPSGFRGHDLNGNVFHGAPPVPYRRTDVMSGPVHPRLTRDA